MQRRDFEQDEGLLPASRRTYLKSDEHLLSLLDRLRACESALATWARNGITLGSLAMLLFVNGLDLKQRCFALVTMWLAGFIMLVGERRKIAWSHSKSRTKQLNAVTQYAPYLYQKDTRELLEVVERHHEEEEVEELRGHMQPGWAFVTVILGVVWLAFAATETVTTALKD